MIENVLLIVLLLWGGGVVFVSACLAMLRALDVLENKYD